MNFGFWNWIFILMDDSGGIFVEIDCNWCGFGFEVIFFWCCDVFDMN